MPNFNFLSITLVKFTSYLTSFISGVTIPVNFTSPTPRALGVGEVKFTGMVTPDIKLVRYEVNFTRVIDRKLKLGMANGTMYADNEKIYSAENMKVGLFQS
mgnify:CR=1 FL=1